MALCASQTSLTSLSLAAPCSTYTFQGCVLVPLGERAATCNKSSNTAFSTGLFKYARVENRLKMAASTLSGSEMTVLTWVVVSSFMRVAPGL